MQTRTDRFAHLALVAGLTIAGRADALRIAPRSVSLLVQGGGTPVVAIGSVGADLHIQVCATMPCDATRGVRLTVPAPFAANGAVAELRLLQLARGFRAGLVRVPDGHGRFWTAIVMPPARAADPARIVFSGVADLAGESVGGAPGLIQLVKNGEHLDVVVGTQDPAVDLCGRPAVLSAKLLDPATAELQPAKLQRLTEVDRTAATRVVATRAADGNRRPLARLLVASGASSALGSPSALTDGDLETSWAENRGGDGRGEFVSTRAPREVPLSSLRITVSPSTVAKHAAAPRRLFVATDQRVFDVVLPEDGTLNPGKAYVVPFDVPLSTSCVAVSLEDAYPSRDGGSSNVTIAEVEAESEVERGRSAAQLIELMHPGDATARAAAGVLLRSGADTRKLVADRYEALELPGRLLALDIADQGTCEEASPLYVRALTSKVDGELRHARTRLERCRKKAVPALSEVARDNAHPAQVRAADELGLISPEDAAATLGQAVLAGGRPARKRLGGLLGRALQSPRSDAAAATLLADATPPIDERLRLLLLARPRLGTATVAAGAREILRAADGSFDTRYLAIPTRAALAAQGDAEAEASLRRELSAPEPAMRARAAAASAALPSLVVALVGATSDVEPRVRAAALSALSHGGSASMSAIAARFDDDWTFVRTAAYQATVGQPTVAFEPLLIARLPKETSSLAMSALVDALAERGQATSRAPLRALVTDTTKTPDVRARAVRGVALLCDRDAVDALVSLAKQGAHIQANEGERVLSGAAIAALGRLHPQDLRARLAFLSGEGIPAPLVSAGRAAIDDKDVCPG